MLAYSKVNQVVNRSLALAARRCRWIEMFYNIIANLLEKLDIFTLRTRNAMGTFE